jgi:hypothetical protein
LSERPTEGSSEPIAVARPGDQLRGGQVARLRRLVSCTPWGTRSLAACEAAPSAAKF